MSGDVLPGIRDLFGDAAVMADREPRDRASYLYRVADSYPAGSAERQRLYVEAAVAQRHADALDGDPAARTVHRRQQRQKSRERRLAAAPSIARSPTGDAS